MDAKGPVNEAEAEVAAIRRQNDQLNQLAEQAVRMEEKLVVSAREAVSAYREYVRSTKSRSNASEPAASHLAHAMENLSRLVGEAATQQHEADATPGPSPASRH